MTKTVLVRRSKSRCLVVCIPVIFASNGSLNAHVSINHWCPFHLLSPALSGRISTRLRQHQTAAILSDGAELHARLNEHQQKSSPAMCRRTPAESAFCDPGVMSGFRGRFWTQLFDSVFQATLLLLACSLASVQVLPVSCSDGDFERQRNKKRRLKRKAQCKTASTDAKTHSAREKTSAPSLSPTLNIETHIRNKTKRGFYHLKSTARLRPFSSSSQHSDANARFYCPNNWQQRSSPVWSSREKHCPLTVNVKLCCVPAHKDQREKAHIPPLRWLPVCFRIDFKIFLLLYEALNSFWPRPHVCSCLFFHANRFFVHLKPELL